MSSSKLYARILIVAIISILITLPASNIKAKCLGQGDVIWNKEKESDFIICIDPGHQKKGDPKGEPMAPGGFNKKPRVSSGTAGIGTKRPEHVVNLEASIILKGLLEDKGYKVVMTRETEDVNLSNAERAEIANNCNADLTIRIHCDSLNDSSKSGATILIPSKKSQFTASIHEESKRYADLLSNELKSVNVKVNGVFERQDITGFNWSKVPVVILEMGFMSNWQEDKMLSDPNYQKKLMESVVSAIENYRNTAS